jgi:hypothetical protein
MGINNTPAGITMTDSIMNLSRGWFVVYNDGSVITEEETTWNKVRKGDIKLVGLKWFDKFWTIPNKTAYVAPFKRGSVSFSSSGSSSDILCEERCIGYYEGSSKVVYRVNERTGRMSMQVI